MNVQIRDATMDDMHSCKACLDAVAREGRWLARLGAGSPEGYAAFWTSMRAAKAPQVVAMDREAVVGWCDIIPDASPCERMSAASESVFSRATADMGSDTGSSSTRCNGRARGLERVELSVREDNVAARVLYERHGFVVECRRIRDWKHDGVYRNSVLMAADIGEDSVERI